MDLTTRPIAFNPSRPSGATIHDLPDPVVRMIAGAGDARSASRMMRLSKRFQLLNPFAGLVVHTVKGSELPHLIRAATADNFQPDMARLYGVPSSLTPILAPLAQLTHLALDCSTSPDAASTAAALRSLQALPRLAGLRLHKADLDREGMLALRDLHALQALILKRCTLADEAIGELPSKLRYFDAADLELTDEQTAVFAKMMGLVQLRLGACREMTDASQPNFPRGLLELEIAHCDFTNLAALPCLSSLRKLVLGTAGTQFTLQGLEEARNLEVLSLPQMKIDDSAALCLATLVGLQSLDLSDCELTDDVIPHLPRDLLSVNLHNTEVTEIGLAQLPRGLLHLDVSECLDVTDAALHALSDLGSLQTLRVSPHLGVTEHGLEGLREALPRCEIELVGPPAGPSGIDREVEDSEGYESERGDSPGYDSPGYDSPGYDSQGYDSQGYGSDEPGPGPC